MYLGATGERFRIISPKGGRRLLCPAGTSEESSGRMATGQQYVWCYRRPEFAPPARTTTTTTYHAPITTVSPGIQAQISPQVSPVLTQAQASPGASFQAQPTQSMPGGMTATGGGTPSGMSAQDLQRILAEQRAADERRRQDEMQAMQSAMTERQMLLDQMRQSEAARMEERESARVAAEADAMQRAMESAEALPPTAGAFVPPSPLQPPIFEPDPFMEPSTEIDITGAPIEAGQPIPYLLLAVAALGTGYMLTRKKGKKR